MTSSLPPSLTRFGDELEAAIRRELADASAASAGGEIPAARHRARVRRGRIRPRLVAGATVGVAGLIVTAVLTLGAAASPPPAFAATRSGPGEVTITLRQIDAISALNARLAALPSRIRVVPVVHGCVAPVHTVSNGRVVPGPARTLEAAPLGAPGGPGGAVVSMTINNDTTSGRTFVVAESQSGLEMVDMVVVGPAPACVGDTASAAGAPFLLPAG